jgi:hypothetical protein
MWVVSSAWGYYDHNYNHCCGMHRTILCVWFHGQTNKNKFFLLLLSQQVQYPDSDLLKTNKESDDVKDQEVRVTSTSSKLYHMPHCNVLFKCFPIFLPAWWGGLCLSVTLKTVPKAPIGWECTVSVGYSSLLVWGLGVTNPCLYKITSVCADSWCWIIYYHAVQVTMAKQPHC